MSWQPGTGGGGGGGGSSSDSTTWGSILNVPEPLEKFAAHPVAFILGVVLQRLLGGIETMVTAILDAIQYVFVGDSVNSTEGDLGVADIPMVAANMLTGAGDTVGSSVLETLDTFVTAITDTALAFGPLSPVALAVEIGVVLVILYYVTTTLLRMALDLIPGAGGLLR